MSNTSSLRIAMPAHELSIYQQGAHLGLSWHAERPLRTAAARWSIKREPRGDRQGRRWFPLPSYYLNDAYGGAPWHHLAIPHGFLILCYLGLWQLPWLWRHHRARRIQRTLAEVA